MQVSEIFSTGGSGGHGGSGSCGGGGRRYSQRSFRRRRFFEDDYDRGFRRDRDREGLIEIEIL